LQGKPVDRIILYTIPKGGIPEHGVKEGTVIAAQVLISGTTDAGRGFWPRKKDDLIQAEYSIKKILPTLFGFP
jgi:hypothetical protein